jgi:hypothetical protein
LLRTVDVPDALVLTTAARVVDAMAGSRATWTSWNLTAETMRQITAAGWQFASPGDTVAVRDRIVTAARELSATLSAGELAAVPDAFRDSDGVSQFARETVFTSTRVLAAEDQLLTLAADQTGPTVQPERAARIANQPAPCADLDAAVEVLRQRPIDAVAPRRRVKWIVRCPSGQLVRGDITVNAARTDRLEAIREHVTEIREILASDNRASK